MSPSFSLSTGIEALTGIEATFVTEATILGCDAGFCVGTLAVAIGAAAGAEAALEIEGCGASFGGTAAAGLTGELTLAAGFAPSLLRNNPRATRNVPFACSTLLGLVRTRLAPIRNAFATPACPSTTATASAD